MIRIKVFPLKKIIYKLQIALLLFIFFTTIILLFSLMYNKKEENVKEVLSRVLVKSEFNIEKSNIINSVLKNKISMLYNIDYDDLAESEEQNIEELIKNENIIENDNKIKIEITEYKKWDKPKNYDVEAYQNGKVRVGNSVISNYSKLNLNLNELQKVSNKNITCDTKFLIFHTHTSETYTINKEEYSDYYRTQNEKYNMLSVGNALSKALISKGYKVLHEKTVHDFPSYNGAYKSSLKTVTNCLEKDDFDIILDIHRDAISSNENFRPTVEVNEKSAAKLMFVVGTNAAGLSHDNWMENLKLAIMIQNRAEEMYPGLFREIHLSNSRYNQQVSDGALILEVGATGNTLEEAQNAMALLAEVISSMK